MNFVTDETIYTGSTNNCSAVNTVNEILQLNNKFPKEYDSSKPAWTDNGSGNSDRPVNSASANHASGFNANTDTWTVF